MPSRFQIRLRAAAAFAFCAAALCLAGAKATVPPGTVDVKGMTLIPAGTYSPLFASSKDAPPIPVSAYYLDTLPVTNGDYLAFVRVNPKWRRSCVSPLFADSNYLRSWAGDLNPGSHAPLDTPVVNVSWFAARAYAHWRGKRLPSTAEWERAAAVGYTQPNGKKDLELVRDLNQWFAATTPDIPHPVTDARPNYLGVRGLFGYIWEWVSDFNTALVNGNADVDASLVCSAGAVGAVDPNDYAAFMRVALRSSLRANNSTSSLGFRCARNLNVTIDGIDAAPRPNSRPLSIAQP